MHGIVQTLICLIVVFFFTVDTHDLRLQLIQRVVVELYLRLFFLSLLDHGEQLVTFMVRVVGVLI